MTTIYTFADRIRLGLSLKDHFVRTVPPQPFNDADYYKKPPKLYKVGNKSQTLSAWARETGINVATLNARIKRGASMHAAISPDKPTRAKKYITFNGRTQTQAQWAEELGLSPSALSHRLNKPSFTLERALTRPRNKKAKAKSETTK